MLNRAPEESLPPLTEQRSPKIKVIDSNEEIYLGSDSFIALSKENPKLLCEIMQKQINNAMEKLYQKKKPQVCL